MEQDGGQTIIYGEKGEFLDGGQTFIYPPNVRNMNGFYPCYLKVMIGTDSFI